MGNENASMCACYDHEAERVRQESNVFQQRIKAMQKPTKNKDVLKNYNEYESVVPNKAAKRTPQIGDSTIQSMQKQTWATSNQQSQQASPFVSTSIHKQYYKDISNTMLSESESKSNSPKMKMNGVTPQKNNQPNGVPPYFNQSISAKKNNQNLQYTNNQSNQNYSRQLQASPNQQSLKINSPSPQSDFFYNQPPQSQIQNGENSRGRAEKKNNNKNINFDGMQINQPRMFSPPVERGQPQLQMQKENQKYFKEQAADDGQYPQLQNLMNGNQYDLSSQYLSGLQSMRSMKSSNSFTNGGNQNASKPRIGSLYKGPQQKILSISDYKKFKKIDNIEQRYLFGKILGQGAFGTVRLCMHRDSQKTFAIKIMQKKAIQQQQIYVTLLQNELSILGEKSHPNIIRIVDLIEDNENYYIVSEVVKGGELFKRLTKVQSFTEAQAAEVVHQIMCGLNYMHLQSVTHRDMKPENILLVSNQMNDFRIKIADLGFAQQFDKEKGLELVLGTPLYMAPELVQHQKYSEKVDVWSLGVIVYQLLSGQTPFDGKDIKEINQNICYKKISFTEKCWRYVSSNAKDFILNCLIKNQYDRPSIQELFEHPWISNIPSNQILDEDIQLKIQKNFIQYQNCSDFQKIVLSLISGLSTTEQELEKLQLEFLRLDKDKTGILNKKQLQQMTSQRLHKQYDIDWDAIIQTCGQNGQGGVDYQAFISACIDKKVLLNQEDVKKAFKMLDTNGDGVISLDDFDNLFNSYGGAKMNQQIWQNLLMEADKNGDGTVNFQEFQAAMGNLLRKSLNKKRRHTTL